MRQNVLHTHWSFHAEMGLDRHPLTHYCGDFIAQKRLKVDSMHVSWELSLLPDIS